MSKWIRVSHRYPGKGLVLAYDNYNKGEHRYAVCEADPKWKGMLCQDGKKRDPLYVVDSICPYICGDSNGHWMELPKDTSKKWKKFDPLTYPLGEFDDVLIRLHSGKTYVAVVGVYDWSPSFNMFKHGHLESIDRWMKLPKPPRKVIHE